MSISCQLDEDGRFKLFSKITLSWKYVSVNASLDTSMIDRCKKVDKPSWREILKEGTDDFLHKSTVSGSKIPKIQCSISGCR